MATFSDSGVFARTGQTVSSGATTPDFGLSKKSKPNVKSVRFGDGYEQRLSVGVQQDPKIWSLTWSTLSDSDADAIELFFTLQQGSQAFIWSPSLDTSTYPTGTKKYVCRQWQRSFKSSNINEIKADFEQVFEQ